MWDVGKVLESIEVRPDNSGTLLHVAIGLPDPQRTAMLTYLTMPVHFINGEAERSSRERFERFLHGTCDHHGRTAFLAACCIGDPSIPGCLDLLFNPRVDNQCDNYGMSAVHLAMQAQNEATFAWMDSRGFDFSIATADNNRYTPAHIAVVNKYAYGLQFLRHRWRDVLLMGGGPDGSTTPLKLCLGLHGKNSRLYSFMYWSVGLGKIEPGSPVPGLVMEMVGGRY
ncbi:hypothetical protein B0T16DRAFT_386275 [Cercophora newfieldiana]|uniref:Uncharacterized protein n=1 Tax=Cercophora newfieldiana TaxID=92897 RepID=A0AA40CZX3_9PEZI|nr:hypothetical protein B0T16DRAFT_386275 [Cercophora newfieldiana]